MAKVELAVMSDMLRDTGWRRIFAASDAPHDWTSGSLSIRRQGPTVTLRFDTLMTTVGDGPAKTPSILTEGFRAVPTTTRDGAWLVSETSGQPHKVILYNSQIWYMGPVNAASMSFTRGTARLRGTISWMTEDAWPTTLPGTPI